MKDSSLPIEPLFSIAAGMSDNPHFTQAEFARMINVTERAISRWKKQGGIPWMSADEASISIGLHPLLVWGDDWLNVKGDFDKLAAQAIREIERDLTMDISEEALA